MSRTYDARRFRRLVAAVGLIGWPLTLVADAVLNEDHESYSQAVLAALEQPGMSMAVAATLLVSAVLTVPGVYGLVHLVRDRGARLVHWGGALLTLGAFGHMAGAAHHIIVVGSASGGSVESTAAMLDRVDQSSAVLLIAPLMVAYGFGVVISAFAVWRAGLLGAWAPALAVLAFAVHAAPVGEGAVALAAGVGKQLAVLAVFGTLGMAVARMRDDEWAPRFTSGRLLPPSGVIAGTPDAIAGNAQ